MRASAGITAGAIAKYVGGPSIMGASRPFFGFFCSTVGRQSRRSNRGLPLLELVKGVVSQAVKPSPCCTIFSGRSVKAVKPWPYPARKCEGRAGKGTTRRLSVRRYEHRLQKRYSRYQGIRQHLSLSRSLRPQTLHL